MFCESILRSNFSTSTFGFAGKVFGVLFGGLRSKAGLLDVDISYHNIHSQNKNVTLASSISIYGYSTVAVHVIGMNVTK